MSRRRWLVVGGFVLAGVVVMAVLAGARGRADGSASGPSLPASSGRVPTASASPTPSVTSAATDLPTPAPTATAQPSPVRSLAPTAPSRATGDPRLAYAAFLLRVNDDRATVEGLNRALSKAAEAQDREAVRTASVAILDFVDGERDWLREHPPAACYAAAHASATAMLDAYGAAADRFITWAAAGGGLSGLAALGNAVDAAQAAGDALTTFGKVLESTKCAS